MSSGEVDAHGASEAIIAQHDGSSNDHMLSGCSFVVRLEHCSLHIAVCVTLRPHVTIPNNASLCVGHAVYLIGCLPRGLAQPPT